MINSPKITPPHSRPTSRPQSIRSRAGSTPGLDTAQIHALLNDRKKNKFASMLCKNNDSVDVDYSQPPTRSMSVISVTSVVSPSSIDTMTKKPHFILVSPAKDSTSLSSEDSALEVSPRKITAKLEEDVIKTPVMTQKVLYIDEIVWKIDDLVYCAGIDASTNSSLLCRLNIEFVCEIVDETTEHVHQNRRQTRGFDCPCLCPRQLNHFRYFVSMNVPENEEKCMQDKVNMATFFDQFIDLVERGRRAGRNVLVCSTRGRNRAPTLCAAYLMSRERIVRGTAVSKVTHAMRTMRPPVNISDFMQRSLMRYQQHLGIDPDNAYDSSHTLSLFSVKRRTAWTT